MLDSQTPLISLAPQKHSYVHTVAVYAQLFMVTIYIQNVFWSWDVLTVLSFQKSAHKRVDWIVFIENQDTY